jgi:transposase
MSYSTNLNDKEWEVIKDLFPKPKTRPIKHSWRKIFDGILYQLKQGCNWGDLPKDFPPYSTVYWNYRKLVEDGYLELMQEKLHQDLRIQKAKKNTQV